MVDGEGLLGFVSIKGAEVVKLYVGAAARGKGVARLLLGYSEKLLARRGIKSAELFCTLGNVRAQKFYVREGWKLSRTFADNLWLPETAPAESFSVQTQHFKKQLGLH
jgi:GNAT superfamily N-acetyltransferase